MSRLTKVYGNGNITLDASLFPPIDQNTLDGEIKNSEPFKAAVAKLADIEDAEENGLLPRLPCKVGDTVYRICPKCNDRHNGSCRNCAWQGCLSDCGCTVYGLWGDGQYPPERCTIVPYKVKWNYIPDLLKHFGKTVFLTREEAMQALKARDSK